MTRVARRAAGLGMAVLAGLVSVPMAAATPAPAAPGAVLVIAVPGLRWQDVDDPGLPALRALLDESAVANLATRVTRAVSAPGEAYLTLGSGGRAVARQDLAGRAYGADERVGVGSAAEEFARQQGRVLSPGGVASLSWPLLITQNASSEFDASLGSLGSALAAAGVDRGVVGNADISDPLLGGGVVPGREVVAGLADDAGRVPCGEVGTVLLSDDAAAPYGQHLDQGAVVEAVARCRTPRSVILVEASDLRRAALFGDRSIEARATAARRDALRRTDALVAALVADLDPERDAVVVVAPTTGTDPGLGVLAIRAPGWTPGLLTSGTTRRDGYALLVDVAPSIASLAGVAMDEGALEGRTVTVVADDRTPPQRRLALVEAEADALFRDRMLDPVVWAFVGAVSLLAVAAAVALAARWRRAYPVLQGLALALLAFPPCTYLAALFPFDEWGAGAYWAAVGGSSVALGALWWLLRGGWLRPLVAACVAIVAVVTTSVVLLGSRLQLSTVFGDSPIVAGRFSGINNVTFGFFFAAAALLGVCIVHVVPGRRGRRWMLAVLAAILAIDVAPMWGADVGGALAGLPALAVVAAGLGRWRVRWRTLGLVALSTLALVVLLGLLDLSREPADRSHLGRLFERIGAEGFGGLTSVVDRKLQANLRSLTTSAWRVVVLAAGLAGAIVAWRARERVRALAAALPALVRTLPGLGVLAVLGYAVNDSGIAVPGAVLGVVVPALVYLGCRAEPTGAVER